MNLQNKDYGEAAKTSLIVIGGGTVLNTFVVQKVQFLSGLLANLPQQFMNISVPLLITGFAAALLAKMFMK